MSAAEIAETAKNTRKPGRNLGLFYGKMEILREIIFERNLRKTIGFFGAVW